MIPPSHTEPAPDDSSPIDDPIVDDPTHTTPRAPLPPRFCQALPPTLRSRVQRLHVVGNGSCADGAIVQAIEQSDILDCLPLSHTLRLVAPGTFRQLEVSGAVAAWTADDWTNKMPASFRDEEWSEKRRIDIVAASAEGEAPQAESSARTPEKELDFFRRVLLRPTHTVGNAFLHAAAGALQQGILLLTMDRRLNRAVYQLDDFGTQQYSTSIILFFRVGPLRQGSRGDGHYETVCLTEPGPNGDSTFTVFEKHHPLLCSLRDWAAGHASDSTMDHSRVQHLCHPAINMRSGEAFSGPPAPDGASPCAGPAAEGPTQAGTRARRPRVLPARLRDQQSGDGRRGAAAEPAVLPATPVARSLRVALHRAASSVPPVDSGAASSSPRQARARQRTTTSAASPAPVVAAPRVQPSERPAVLGESARRNLLAWVREGARRGRLASRVHLSAVPMWTARCRTVLQGLASALQESPMNEAQVITWLCVLWLLPQEVFTIPGRMRGGKAGRKSRHHRIHHILNDAALLGRLAARVEERTGHVADSESRPAGAPAAVDAVQSASPAAASLSCLSPAGQHSDDAAALPDSELEVNEPARTAPDDEVRIPSADERVAARVEHLFRQGHAQRAMRALVSTTGMADLDQPVERATLRALHPQGPFELPPCPSDAPELVVDPSWMAAEMLHSDTGAAAGPSGYGSNHLRVLADDAACVTAMAVLISHIVNDKLPATVRSLLNTCTLVSLEKQGGGRRPVAMGDMFYRMAARFALSLVLQPAQRALRPHQFGVGAEDGCTQVVQSLQHLLTLPPTPAPAPPRPPHQFAFSLSRPAPPPPDPTPRPLACLSIDVANAFNTVDRAALLRAVYANAELAPCWRMVAFGYGHSSLLLMPCGDEVSEADAFIESSTGVRQGDPLAALLFALAMHTVYDQVARICRAGCFAYSDDSHGVGWVEECWRVWEALPDLLSPLGLRLNAGKCELTCFHTDSLQHAADVEAMGAFHAAGVKVHTSTLKVLGCVVGSSDAAIARHLQRREFRADQRAAFRRIPLLSKHTGYLTLTQLTGAVLTYRLRAMPPAATEAHAAEYDGEVLRLAHGLVGIREEDGDRYDEQLRWPARLGGFGLLSAVRIAPAAYLAGAECTLRSSPAFSAMWRAADELEPTWPLTATLDDAIGRIAATEAALLSRCDPAAAACVGASILPTRAAAFVPHFKALPPSPIQSAIIHRITTLSHNARMTAAAGEGGPRAEEEVARLQALKEKESSRWLRVMPLDAELRLTDLQWQTAAQLRLGVPKAPHRNTASPCVHEHATATDGWHTLVCIQRSGPAINTRHHAVVRLLADAAAALKVHARIEPYDLCADDKHRPDLQLDLPEYTLLGDVTISHPCAARWRTVAADRGVEAVGDARSAEKDATYTPMAEALGVRFSPFVLYTYGGFHKSALFFVDQMAGAYDPAVALVSLSEWKDGLKDRIAVCVQRCTANIVIEDARLARAAAFVKGRRRARTVRSNARRRGAGSRALPPRQLPALRNLRGLGARAVEVSAPLLAESDSSPSLPPAGVDSDAETVAVASPEFPEDAGCERALSALSLSPAVCAGVSAAEIAAGEVSTAAAVRMADVTR
jgi:hypothetical protein